MYSVCYFKLLFIFSANSSCYNRPLRKNVLGWLERKSYALDECHVSLFVAVASCEKENRDKKENAAVRFQGV